MESLAAISSSPKAAAWSCPRSRQHPAAFSFGGVDGCSVPGRFEWRVVCAGGVPVPVEEVEDEDLREEIYVCGGWREVMFARFDDFLFNGEE